MIFALPLYFRILYEFVLVWMETWMQNNSCFCAINLSIDEWLLIIDGLNKVIVYAIKEHHLLFFRYIKKENCNWSNGRRKEEKNATIQAIQGRLEVILILTKKNECSKRPWKCNIPPYLEIKTYRIRTTNIHGPTGLLNSV